ncbi:RES domain-containing protein [Paraburkholderia sp. 32]|uniref:RES domain-containing protein n=1 Tax=unclassified Paraburkholderia TaxID=2615204 RepID=UPI003D22690C
MPSNPAQHSTVVRVCCPAEPVVLVTTLSYPYRIRSRYFRFFVSERNAKPGRDAGLRDATTGRLDVTVAVGLFETTRPIRFFDFRNFKNFRAPTKLGYWYEDYEERQICRELLLHLPEVIAKPVREGETGYITTQAMVEFIRHKLAGDFGGVIFSSVQHAGGTNFVVFSDSAVSALLDDLTHEPTFPVKLHDRPQFFHIDAVAYTSKPLKVESSASV